ncbi:MAG: hypothetical protein JXA50_01715 [Deltaproteobacteria bacterium]|nr:hypothetical protein [Deltaproteobacteria bacterium]
MKRPPLRDPIQEVIDRQGRSLPLDQPCPQKHCHSLGALEDEILDALDKKESYGAYAGMRPVEAFSLV